MQRAKGAGRAGLAQGGELALVARMLKGPTVDCASDRFRRRAYAEFAKRKSAPVVHEVIVPEDSIKAGYELLAALRSLDPVPDAVFTGSDDLAAGLVAAAKREGLLVPHDLAVLGFDDQPIAEVFEISTLRQPVRLMGRRAMEVLMQLIEHGLEAPVKQLTKVKYSLVTRKTA